MTTIKNPTESYTYLGSLVRSCPPPDYVLDAPWEKLASAGTTEAYADPRSRRLPCGTKAATWLSAAAFADQRDGLDEKQAQTIENRIKVWAKMWGISKDVDGVLAPRKKASATHFALGTSYPIDTVEQVKMAATYLSQHRERLTFPQRHEMATSILKRAEDLNISSLPHLDVLQKSAGIGSCSKSAAVDAVRSRRRLLDSGIDPEARAFWDFTRQDLINHPGVPDRETRLKLAEALDAADRRNGWTRLYGDQLKYPEDSLFEVTLKLASDWISDHVVLSDGSTWKKSDFAEVPLTAILNTFGHEAVKSASIGGVVCDADAASTFAASLSTDRVDLWRLLMKQAGCAPVEEGETIRKLDREALKIWADVG